MSYINRLYDSGNGLTAKKRGYFKAFAGLHVVQPSSSIFCVSVNCQTALSEFVVFISE